MQKIYGKKLSSCILCMVLIVAMALFTTGCNGSTGSGSSSSAQGGTEAQADGGAQADNAQTGTDVNTEPQQLGEGTTQFSFTVVDQDGKETVFEIHTDKEIVGDALTELGLIDGEESEYGLFVKTVNGITADYDKDGVYWAFYINGEYASTGVDSTAITEGDSYTFKVE